MQQHHPEDIRIDVFPRLHLTLIDLAANGYRRNGGVGFAIDTLLATLIFRSSNTTRLLPLSEREYGISEIESLTNRLETIRSQLHFKQGVALVNVSPFRRHCGLGAGTAITLACIEALFIANNARVDPNELQRISGRGGTSGIGVNTYFTGGLVFDLGREIDGSEFVPSESAIDSGYVPLMCNQIPMPAWPIGFFSPSRIQSIDVEEEARFFRNTCPIPQSAVYETTYHVVFGILAAVLANRFDSFCESVNALQDCFWKSAEISIYGEEVSGLMAELRGLDCQAVGMSSLGPGLYFLAKDFDRVFTAVNKQFPNENIVATLPRNMGRGGLLG